MRPSTLSILVVLFLLAEAGAAWSSSHDDAPPIQPDPRAAGLYDVARGAEGRLGGDASKLSAQQRAWVARVQRLQKRLVKSQGSMSPSQVDEVMTEIDIVDDQLADANKASFDPPLPSPLPTCTRSCGSSAGRRDAAGRAGRLFCIAGCLLQSR